MLENVEKWEPSCTVGGNANWCSHFEKEYGVYSKSYLVLLKWNLNAITSVLIGDKWRE